MLMWFDEVVFHSHGLQRRADANRAFYERQLEQFQPRADRKHTCTIGHMVAECTAASSLSLMTAELPGSHDC